MPDLTASGVRQDFNSVLENGNVVRFRYFNSSFVTGSFDDVIILTQSGVDFYTSGLILPLEIKEGSKDALLVEQGLLLLNDLKMFVAGTVQTSGLFKIGIGSPTGFEYSTIEPGVKSPEIGGAIIFKRLYLRRLITGSLSWE
jgi:hypothetical protein